MSAVFMNMMKWTYKPYLDRPEVDHQLHPKILLELLRNKKLYAKSSKSEIWLSDR